MAKNGFFSKAVVLVALFLVAMPGYIKLRLHNLRKKLDSKELRQCQVTIAQQKEQLVALMNANCILQDRLQRTERHLDHSIRDMVVQREKHRQEVGALRAKLGRDDLTGLLRRDAAARAFRRHASEGERRTKRVGKGIPGFEVSVLFIDIDHFKQVNDQHGHAMGDRVLIEVARTISELLRENDIPCRRGGEELVTILDNASKKDAKTTAERIREAVQALKFMSEKGRLTVTVSIGVARVPIEEYPRNPDEALEVGIRWADAAMYEAKRAGRNRTVVSPE